MKMNDHGRRYLETTVDLLFPNHAWNVDPAVIYNGGYDHCRPLRGKSGTASVGGPAAVLSTIVVTLLQWSGEWGRQLLSHNIMVQRTGIACTWGYITAYLFSVVISLIVSLTGTVLTPWLLKIMNTPQDMMTDSITYLRIYFMGILFTLVYNMGSAIMRAVGDSRRPLLYLLICCVMNIILDIAMVVGMKMGIAGAALATVISQCVSAVLVTWSLTRAYDAMKLKFRELRMDARVLRKELKIGVPGALQACAYGVTNVVIQASVNSLVQIPLQDGQLTESLI